jgi:hypothetical protein
MVQQRLSRAAWGREVDKMIGWGAVVDPPGRDTLLDYLSAHFGQPSPSPGARDSPDGAGAALVRSRCLTCHDMRLIEQQRLAAAGWTREVDKMIGWGASLTEAEKAAVIAHLAAFTVPASPP